MNETRQLLKIFGVAVTDFEVEAEKLQKAAAQFSHDTGKQETAVGGKPAYRFGRACRYYDVIGGINDAIVIVCEGRLRPHGDAVCRIFERKG